MIFPIERVAIKITSVANEISFMYMDAPNGDDPFFFALEEVPIRGKFRDKNNILRRGYTLYQVRWTYNYATHEMDLRTLLTAKEIELAAPPTFAPDNYPAHEVRFINQEVIKNYLGIPGGGHTYESFDTIPSGQVTLEFELKAPIEWSDVLAIAWFETPES